MSSKRRSRSARPASKPRKPSQTSPPAENSTGATAGDRAGERAGERAGGRTWPHARRASGRWRTLAASVVIIAAGLAAYSNSFRGPYIFDDQPSIPKNPYIKAPLLEAWRAPADQTVAGRPVLSLSLAVNYRISKLDVWSYHAVNLAIHIAAALVLYGLVRRTLLLGGLAEKFARPSGALALICAVIWLVHPLNTGSVTYIIQRAESLMGLFYLLTLYLAMRGLTCRRGRYWWYAAATLACLLGMGTKEVMFTAPIMVLLYDMIFVSRSATRGGLKRWTVHLALAATWIPFFLLVRHGYRTKSVGLDLGISAFDYAKSQCNVIVHYLRLAFWPTGLSLDYDWPIVRAFSDYAAAGTVLLAILAVVAIMLVRRPRWGYLGAWTFIILGPTSSFLPIPTEVAAEHRMYLPLAGIVVAVVIGVYLAGRRLVSTSKNLAGAAVVTGWLGAIVLATVLGAMTYGRNIDYRSRISIWRAATEKVPRDSRAFHNLGIALADAGRNAEAVKCYTKAIELRPTYVAALAHRGISYNSLGRYDKAMADFRHVLKLDPNNVKARIGLGVSEENVGDTDAAMQRFLQAVGAHPDSAVAWNNLATSYDGKGLHDKAIECYTKAIALDPGFVSAWINRGAACAHKGLYERAIRNYDRAIELDPNAAQAYNNRGVAYGKIGQFPKAIADYNKAIELDSGFIAAYRGRAEAYERMRNWPKALADYDKAVELGGDDAGNYIARSSAYERHRMYGQAIADINRAISISPSASAFNSRGILYGKGGDNARAVADFDRAIELDPAYVPPYSNRGMALTLQGRYDRAIADLRKAISLKPDFATTYVHLAAAQAGKKDYRGAIATLQRALTLSERQKQPQAIDEIRRRIEAYRRALTLSERQKQPQAVDEIRRRIKAYRRASTGPGNAVRTRPTRTEARP